MDAKVGDWVVTPRRGKAVEINALWYNALVSAEAAGLDEEGDEACRRSYPSRRIARARIVQRAVLESGGGYLFDVVDGEHGDDSDACRPNQLFAISLRSSGARRAITGSRCWKS